MGVVRSGDPLLEFPPPPDHIFGIGEAGHFKYRILIDTEDYACMITPERDVFRVT